MRELVVLRLGGENLAEKKDDASTAFILIVFFFYKLAYLRVVP